MGNTHRRRRKKSRKLLKLLTGMAMAAFGVYFLFSRVAPLPETRHKPPVLPARVDLRPQRPVYPYSVIRGGAYTPAELRGALRSDPVAAKHYAGFFQETVHPAVLPQSLLRYVSFRKDDRIYWTRKPVTLRPGESVLTDGTRSARARCGNQISETPQLPVLAEDPPPETWEQPIDEPDVPPVASLPPPPFDPAPARPPRVAPEIFKAVNLVALTVAPAPNSGTPFLWAGARTGGLVPFAPTASSSDILYVNVPAPGPNPPESRPVAPLPSGSAPPVIVFAGPPPAPPPVPRTLEIPRVPSNPPKPQQPPTDGPPPPGPPPVPPPSDPPLPPVVPPTDPPVGPLPVPEPAVYLLVGIGLLLLATRRSAC